MKEYGIKATLFWSVYFLDKSLSLRLGRSSTLQDYDVSATMDFLSADPYSPCWIDYAKVSIEMATLQGLIYDKLYSPGSIKKPSERQVLGQDLINRIGDLLTRNTKVSLLIRLKIEEFVVLIHSAVFRRSESTSELHKFLHRLQ